MATNLFLRICRPGACMQSLTASSSCPSSAEAFFREIVGAHGIPQDASAEAHLHWLDAWIRLPSVRGPLTNWYPREALLARKLSLCARKSISVSSSKLK